MENKKNKVRGISIDVDADMSSLTKKLKVIAKHTEALAKELNEINRNEPQDDADIPLLVIELDSVDSVPRVYYQGKELNNKVNIQVDWTTKGEENAGLNFGVSYFDNKDAPTVIRYGREMTEEEIEFSRLNRQMGTEDCR